jgi:hypothetical protein
VGAVTRSSSSEGKYSVWVEVDGVTYRGRRSVHQHGGRVWIDDGEVGVDVDRDGNPIQLSSGLASSSHPYRTAPSHDATSEAQPSLAESRLVQRRVAVATSSLVLLAGGLLLVLGVGRPSIVASLSVVGSLSIGALVFSFCAYLARHSTRRRG